MSDTKTPIDSCLHELEREFGGLQTWPATQRMVVRNVIERNFATLELDLTRLRAEVAELEADKRRLDWLERAKPNLVCIVDFADDDTEREVGTHWEVECAKGNFEATTLREAIDQAIAQQKEGETKP